MKYTNEELQWMANVALSAKFAVDGRYISLVTEIHNRTGLSVVVIEQRIMVLSQP